MADSMNVVNQILARPFDSLPYEEKIRVKQQGRSTPKNDLVQKVGKSIRSFQHSWYDKVSWLTGSAVTNKMCCLVKSGFWGIKSPEKTPSWYNRVTDHLHK